MQTCPWMSAVVPHYCTFQELAAFQRGKHSRPSGRLWCSIHVIFFWPNGSEHTWFRGAPCKFTRWRHRHLPAAQLWVMTQQHPALLHIKVTLDSETAVAVLLSHSFNSCHQGRKLEAANCGPPSRIGCDNTSSSQSQGAPVLGACSPRASPSLYEGKEP
ncbi:TPA: hypothetical protein BOS_4456 [Bos taurus]|nr:TPA: hypothetical protein BOS_4456 [Bos taurus]